MFDIKEEDGTNYDPGIKFYENVAGSFTVGRLAGSIDVTQNTMRIAKIMNMTMDASYDETIHSETFSHELNYIPEVIGSYYITSSPENRRMLGDWVYVEDDSEYSPYPVGYLWVDNVTDRLITLSYQLNPYFPTYSDVYEKDKLHIKILLLRNESV